MNYQNKFAVYDLANQCEDSFDLLQKPKRWFYEWLYTGENWQIVNSVNTLALQLKNNGINHYGINHVLGYLRFQTAIGETTVPGDEEFKLNNDIAPFLSRMVMRGTPELDGFFKIRTRQ